MRNGQMGTPPMARQTNTTENITFLQLRWRAVITTRYESSPAVNADVAAHFILEHIRFR